MQPLNVHFENSELLAVPAVHFSHVFAAEVNRLCAHPETRPEAIAVELGPQTAAAVAERLRQLCLGPGGRKPLPVMLGLTRPNRMVRAGSRGKGLRCDGATGLCSAREWRRSRFLGSWPSRSASRRSSGISFGNTT